jgi:hypothetical protein
MAKTKFNKNVAWLEPFFAKAKGLVPIHKVSAIKGFSVPLEKTECVDGQMTKHEDGYIVITLRTHNQILRANQNGTNTAYRHKRRMICDVLLVLAHELAHLKYWEHTPEHWELECKIIRRFISELKRRGVKDITTRKPKDVEKSNY